MEVRLLDSVLNKEVPEEIKGWSWGAFALNGYWGIGNKCYLSLLVLIPLFGLIWIFVCGFKGNGWAWKKGNYSSIEEFLLVQNTWNRAGLIVTFFYLVILISLIFI